MACHIASAIPVKRLEELVRWEIATNEDLLEEAREEIARSWRRVCADHADHPRAGELFDLERLPAFHDPSADDSD